MMEKYRVKIPWLNMRREPVADFMTDNIITAVPQNVILDLEEEPNVLNPALGKWYRDVNNHYYNEIGLELFSSDVNIAIALTQSFAWWLKNKLYSIPDLWTLDDSKTVTIAILDTGINEHIDFNFDNITGFNYLDNSKNYKIDSYGHGTHLAGIMVAKGNKSFGVSPNSKLFVAKVCDDDGFADILAVKNALQDIYDGKSGEIGVINMSFELIAKNEEEYNIRIEIDSLLTKLTEEKNIFIICSSGSTEDSFDSFPSIHNSCLAVGFLNSELKRNTASRITPTLDIMAPGTEINSSYQKDSTTALSGTSQAAAFVSAAIALVLQKKINSAPDIFVLKKALLSSAYSESYPVSEYGHGIINPNNFYKQII